MLQRVGSHDAGGRRARPSSRSRSESFGRIRAANSSPTRTAQPAAPALPWHCGCLCLFSATANGTWCGVVPRRIVRAAGRGGGSVVLGTWVLGPPLRDRQAATGPQGALLTSRSDSATDREDRRGQHAAGTKLDAGAIALPTAAICLPARRRGGQADNKEMGLAAAGAPCCCCIAAAMLLARPRHSKKGPRRAARLAALRPAAARRRVGTPSARPAAGSAGRGSARRRPASPIKMIPRAAARYPTISKTQPSPSRGPRARDWAAQEMRMGLFVVAPRCWLCAWPLMARTSRIGAGR